MAGQFNIDLEIAQPIELELAVDSGYIIVPSYVPASEPLFLNSEAFKLQQGDKARIDDAVMASVMFTEGAKKTGVDAGILHQQSITDDYLYYRVQGGDTGTAIWKKVVLFGT